MKLKINGKFMFEDKSIYQCSYCGEQAGVKSKYCSTCKTQVGRKKIFEENAKILKENLKKGFNIPKALPNWK